MADLTSISSNNQQSALAAASAAAVPTLPANKQLGESDFLNLLVTQLKNQDPLKPVDNQEFVAQLAQFSQLQQSTQQVSLLQQLINAQTANQQYSLLPLIGHQVNVSGSLIQLGSDAATFSYSLTAKASAVSVTIANGDNQAVRVLNLGAQNAGRQEVQWDGLDQNGVAVKPGTYKYAVTAMDSNGKPVTATTTSLVTVSGVQPNAGQSASLLAGDQVVDPSTIMAIH
jgi:flagellar basal-body rod modification protein FlgD